MMHFTLSVGGTKLHIFFYLIASSCWTTGQNPWRELHYRRRRRFSGWNGEDMVYTSSIAMTVYRPLGAKGPRKRSSATQHVSKRMCLLILLSFSSVVFIYQMNSTPTISFCSSAYRQLIKGIRFSFKSQRQR